MRQRWLAALRLAPVCLTRPRFLSRMPFYRGPGFQRSGFRVSFENHRVLLAITHRRFHPKVMQRTDCRLTRVFFVSSISGYLPHAPPVVTDRPLALVRLRSLGPMPFRGRLVW
jgi:hypothetical protein